MPSPYQRLTFTGERFVPEESGNIAVEHLHRYVSATDLVKSKVVLDIASGEGYGSNLLAQHASQVYGVDIAVDAVEHAKKRYRRSNLEFYVGDCANIPLGDHTVDVVVSFETLEHHSQHEASFIEFKRVLRPGGKLLISSPDKQHYTDDRGFHNEFHVKELYEQEFRDLVARHFQHTAFSTQRIAFGSIILPLSMAATARSYHYTDNQISSAPGILKPLYLLALASDESVDPLEAGIFEQPINETEIIRSCEQVMATRDAEVDELRSRYQELQIEKSQEISALHSEVACERSHALEMTAARDLAIKKSDALKKAMTEKLSTARAQVGTETKKTHEMKGTMEAMTVQLAALRSEVNSERAHSKELAEFNQIVLTSKSWKITAPLRLTRRKFDELLSCSSRALSRSKSYRVRMKNALGYVRRGDFKGLVHRSLHYRQQARAVNIQQRLGQMDNTWGIMTTPHTHFIAECIAERLALRGINCVILTGPQNNFDLDFYIVLCAQMFEKLPPGEKRVVFQLEQSVSSRWFTPEYFSVLKNSVAVLDYSLVNIEFLAGKGIAYPHIFHLPVGTSLPGKLLTPPPLEKKYDFVFYGDYYSSPRRGKMLEALKSRFNVKLCNNNFGNDMYEIIRSARAVINIHYYENALLETPRIQECLSLGVPVLSESAQDQADYPELAGAVHFFEQDSIKDMLSAAENMLKIGNSLNESVASSVAASTTRFTFMFDRFLTALGVLPAKKILDSQIYIPGTRSQIALSLPETIHRRRVFNQNKPHDCVIFDGIRNAKGWIGCGCSYSALANHARSAGVKELTVFEDDVLFRDNHASRLATIRNYLAETTKWDIFSGMIASLHADTRVLNVETVEDITFVTLDRMTSMVFNIYNDRAIDLLADWDPENLCVDSNTIDRYLENQDTLQVVVTLPFLVGHREDVNSTLWGFANSQYSTMISQAENTIRLLADEWLESNPGPGEKSLHLAQRPGEMENA